MHIDIKNIAGVNTIFGHLPESTSTTIEIMVKAGSIYETEKTNGISHFLEHMFFKGGKKYTTPQAVSEVVDAFGGEFNAYTSEEYAGYYVKSAPEYLAQSIDVLADMLVHAQFPESELEREKGVIIQEIKMYEDMPHYHVQDLWKHRYYGDNNYGRPILGPVKNIKSFTPDHFFAHKEALYTKDNLVIVIVGKIDNSSAIETQIGELFSGLPNQKTITPAAFYQHIPAEHEASKNLKTQQNHLVIGAAGRSMHDDKRYAASLMANILGGTMSSRLFQEIREKRGLCYYVSASHDSGDVDGTFIIRAGIEKERRSLGLEAIYTELSKIANGDISTLEYEKALGNIKGKTQMGIETSDNRSSFLGKQRLFRKQIKSMEEILQNYEKTTIEQIQHAAKALEKEKLFAYWVE